MDEFELIYRQYFALVFSYARRLTGSDHLAEELTADTFFKALKALNRYDEQENLQAWLCTIAKNTWRSQHRKYGRITSTANLPEPQDSAASPAETLEKRDAAWQLHELLHAMPEPYKEVFSLRVFGELPFAQIGRLFGKTETWARVTHHRAKQKIFGQMEDEHD